MVETPEEMAEAISNIVNINRKFCRRYALQNFDVEKMTDQYELVYQTILKGRYKSIRKTSKTNHVSPFTFITEEEYLDKNSN